jgi:hypothetical protein
VSSCKPQRSPKNHSFMGQSQSRSLHQASLREAMVCRRRIKIVGGVIRSLSAVLRPAGLVWRCWFPLSIEMIYESCFSSCKSLASVIFDANSRLSRLEKDEFYGSGFRSIHFPGSLEVICESCFSSGKSLAPLCWNRGECCYRFIN